MVVLTTADDYTGNSIAMIVIKLVARMVMRMVIRTMMMMMMDMRMVMRMFMTTIKFHYVVCMSFSKVYERYQKAWCKSSHRETQRTAVV